MKTFGQRATEALFALFDRAKLSGKPRAMARENLAGDMADLLDEMAGRARLVAKAAKGKGQTTAELDGIWIGELEQKPVYAGVDVRRQLGMAQAWCEVNRRQVTRKMFINWLARATTEARPVAVNGRGQSSFANGHAPKGDESEPLGWRAVLLRIYPTLDREAVAAKTWADLSPATRADVNKAMR